MKTKKKAHPKACICAACEDERRKQKRRDRDARRRARKATAITLGASGGGKRPKGRGVGALLGGGRASSVKTTSFTVGEKWKAPPGVSHVVVTGFGGGGGGGGPALPTIRLDFGARVHSDLAALHRIGLFGRTVEKVAEGLLLAELRRLVLEGWLDPKARGKR